MKYPAPMLDSLAKIYVQHDTTVDSLAQDPDGLARVAIDLAEVTGTPITPHDALGALFYARKKKLLPPIRRTPR